MESTAELVTRSRQPGESLAACVARLRATSDWRAAQAETLCREQLHRAAQKKIARALRVMNRK